MRALESIFAPSSLATFSLNGCLWNSRPLCLSRAIHACSADYFRRRLRFVMPQSTTAMRGDTNGYGDEFSF